MFKESGEGVVMERKRPITSEVGMYKRLQKKLSGISFSVSRSKDGKHKLKLGKKIILLECPSNEVGQKIKGELEALFRRNAEEFEALVMCIENHAVQQELQLFGNKSEPIGNDDMEPTAV